MSGVGAPVNEAYLNADGTLNNRMLVKTINCFDYPGGTGTNLATPIKMAKNYLAANGRAGAALT